MRIVFIGSGEFGLPTIKTLSSMHDVPLVVSQPDKPAGRKRVMTPTPIAAWAEEQGIETIKPENINEPEFVSIIRSVEPDAIVVIAFGQKIGDAVIGSPKYGPTATMNLHSSLLPKYRGAAPINWAVLEGEAETGVTVINLADRMDAGSILGHTSTPIRECETAGELHDRLAGLGPALVLDTLNKVEAGTLETHEQDHDAATRAPKLSRADAVVDFSATADAVRCRIHGLTPWPGVSIWWADDSGKRHALKVLRVVPDHTAKTSSTPGTMIDDGIVATGEGTVRLDEVQAPGKRAMSWKEFQNGHNLPRGTQFFARESD